MNKIKGPWYITITAVEQYCAIRRWPDDDEHFIRAEDDLLAVAKETVASSREPRRQENGNLRYRGPKPGRLQLIVAPAQPPAQPLPQLVAVLPSHGAGRQ